MIETLIIRPKERDAILQSLRAGVVPRSGQQHIQVGRIEEIKALVADMERIADGGSAIRFVIGEYGAGKTFFLFLARAIALQQKLVTVHADLAPDRRIHATGGQARGLYAELMRNMATRVKPEGGALEAVVEKFINLAVEEARAYSISPEKVILSKLKTLTEMVGGFDFATVIAAYWRGYDTGDETLKSNAIRWLRGEFTSRADAKSALGIRTIVDDSNVYDQLKLMAIFVRQAGYTGLLICLDELVNLYKLTNKQSRTANYEQILRILNDCLQGSAAGYGFILGGTPEFLLDNRRGLYSYPALASRLAENTFSSAKLKDYTAPVLRLESLTKEDFFVLLRNLRHVYAGGDQNEYLMPDEGLEAFMRHCHKSIGDEFYRTPRKTIKSFIDLLAILEQNTQVEWSDLIQKVSVEREINPDKLNESEISDEEEELASFRI